MVFEQPIGNWHVRLVPTVVAGFVTGDQENCDAARVKGL